MGVTYQPISTLLHTQPTFTSGTLRVVPLSTATVPNNSQQYVFQLAVCARASPSRTSANRPYFSLDFKS